jgi:hypothetical protein
MRDEFGMHRRHWVSRFHVSRFTYHLSRFTSRSIFVHIIAGILLVITGVFFPMAMLVWLGGRMRQQPPPRPRQVGMWLAFNFVLPVGMVLLGLSLISPQFGASTTIRYATWAALGAALVLLIALAIDAARARGSRGSLPTGDTNGG